MHPGEIAELLSLYPDQRFVDTLITIATSGARLGYVGPLTGQTQQPNHASSYSHADVITKQIQNEVAKGRVKEIASLPPNYFCSPIGLVPKISNGIQIGWRLIFDLSSPEGYSVNDYIPKEYGTIAYETLDDAIRLVAQAGKGAKMMKRDLKSAFRHIPINPCDYWLLLFEWQGKFYVDMFLPFGLRTAPRIFNLFSEALHWVFETLEEWNVTHYLDDFLVVFPPGVDITPYSNQFDRILATFGLSKSAEKDSSGCVVIHLGFEFDSNKMEVRLPDNKKQRALDAVNSLISSSSVSLTSLESTLGFLSHCCQVVPLGRPFLRNLFSLLCRYETKRRFTIVHIPRAIKGDLHWWKAFLMSWSSISIIQISRVNHDIATDASGLKGIGGVHKRHVFSERVPTRHKQKHIDWKEMFAILHAFLLWHQLWFHGTVRIACDNTAVVDAINKRSIKGATIRPLQTILLVAAVHDINLLAFWIPSKENIVADAASRHDYEKLANLGLQVTRQSINVSVLRRKLKSFYEAPSHHQPDKTTNELETIMNRSVDVTDISRSLPLSNPSQVGLHTSCARQNLQQQRITLKPSGSIISKKVSQLQYSTIPSLNSLSREGSVFMGKEPNDYVSHLPSLSSHGLLDSSVTMKNRSTSRRQSVWHLPPFYDVENLREILHGPTMDSFSHVNTFSFAPIIQ